MVGAKRNSGNIYDDIRALLKLFPVKDAAGLRVALAWRIEMDEETGEVFGDARAKIQDTSGIEREPTFKQGLKSCKAAGIGEVQRVYSRGDQLGAKYVLTRYGWNDASRTESVQDGKRPGRKASRTESVQDVGTATVPDGGTATVPDIEDTSKSTAKLTSMLRDNGADPSLHDQPPGAHSSNRNPFDHRAPPPPPSGRVAATTSKQQPTDDLVVQGDVTASRDGTGVGLVNGLRQKWITFFGGDEVALDIGLAGVVLQINSRTPWESQVGKQLSWKAQDVRTRATNYEKAAARNQQSGHQGPRYGPPPAPPGAPSRFK